MTDGGGGGGDGNELFFKEELQMEIPRRRTGFMTVLYWSFHCTGWVRMWVTCCLWPAAAGQMWNSLKCHGETNK